MALRNNGINNEKYIEGRSIGCLGLGNKKAMSSIDEIVRTETATFDDALSKWGLIREQANEIAPIVLTGGYDKDRFGKDSIRRFFRYKTFILGFTEQQVLLFVKEWNIKNDDGECDVKEFFYRDVTSITVSEKVKDGKKENQLILNVSGEFFESPLLPEEDFPSGSISGVRNLIREKKR